MKIIIIIFGIMISGFGIYYIGFYNKNIDEKVSNFNEGLKEEKVEIPKVELKVEIPKVELKVEIPKVELKIEINSKTNTVISDKETSIKVENPIGVKTTESKIKYPIILKSGQFYSTDIKSSGEIKIYDYGDKKILRIENLKTTKGPDLKLYLGKQSNLKNEKDLHLGKIKISDLKSNTGNHDYIIPDGTNLDDFQSVAIHCDTYDHSFGFANIK